MPFDGKLPAKPGGVAATLIKAKEIQQRGWCQNRYSDSAGRRCISQSLQDAGRLQDVDFDNSLPVVFIQFMRSSNIKSVSDWNDAKDRTYDDVIAAFDKAIDDALVAEAV